jgi:hypothetical protein
MPIPVTTPAAPAETAIAAPVAVPIAVRAPVAPAEAPIAAPVVPAAPVAVPAPAPAPVAPVAAPAPVAPAPVVNPVPAPMIAAVAPAQIAPRKLDAKAVEQIFSCLAPGLPQDWKRTWVVVSAESTAATKFYFTSSFRDEDAEEFVPCNAQEITRRITSLNETLPSDQRRWKSARLVIDNEGEFELKYDYAR